MKNELYEKWDDILENMKTEFEISAPIYRTFVKTLSIYHVEGNKLTVLIDDVKIGNSKSFVEQRYSLFLAISIEEFTGIQYDISFVSRSELGQQKADDSEKKEKKHNNPTINSKYTFDTFVVGDNNDYAHAAALKVAEENINIDDSILDYIASNIISNIRELQGAINKVLSFSDFCNTEITLESAKKALVDIINPNMKRQITIDYIMETVADHFHITMKDLLSSKRNSNIVYPRHICMYLCRQLTNSTYEEIGSKIGNRHHSTILHGEEIIKKKLDEGDEESIKTIDVLTKKIDPQ